MARREIGDVHSEGRLPILVGGTGLYLRTLLDGIAPVPEIDPEVRQRVRAASVEENRQELERLDPGGAARLNIGDSARISRALEVVVSTGRTLADWQQHHEGGIGTEVDLRPLILLPPRNWLYPRCDAASAWSRSQRMSSSDSSPIDSRIISGDTPAARCSVSSS